MKRIKNTADFVRSVGYSESTAQKIERGVQSGHRDVVASWTRIKEGLDRLARGDVKEGMLRLGYSESTATRASQGGVTGERIRASAFRRGDELRRAAKEYGLAAQVIARKQGSDEKFSMWVYGDRAQLKAGIESAYEKARQEGFTSISTYLPNRTKKSGPGSTPYAPIIDGGAREFARGAENALDKDDGTP